MRVTAGQTMSQPNSNSKTIKSSSENRHDASEPPFTIREMLSTRQAKRAAKAAERRERSETLKEEGNTFFRKGDYHRAIERYQQAIEVHGRSVKPVLLTNLANAYHNLGKHYEAHEAADKALDGDPKSVKARYRRAIARKNMDMWRAAAIDFRIVLKLDPRYQEVKKELAYVEKCRRENRLLDQEDTAPDSEHELPAIDDEPNLEESLSESSDCEHTGNGKPCKFYNHTGCTKARACRFSHAPDDESERDALGRNVCRYYLMDLCRFGERCIYSHSKEFLLKKGWWSTADGIGKAKSIYNFQQKLKDAAIKYEKEEKASLGSQPTPAQKKSSKRKKKRAERAVSDLTGSRSGVAAVGHADRSAPANLGQSSQSTNLNSRISHLINAYASPEDHFSDDTDDDDEYFFGFSNSELQELWCHGIKPWDNEARDFISALHDGYGKNEMF